MFEQVRNTIKKKADPNRQSNEQVRGRVSYSTQKPSTLS
jgi:hypothetical protein